MTATAEPIALDAHRGDVPPCQVKLQQWLGLPLVLWTSQSDGTWVRRSPGADVNALADRHLTAALEDACRDTRPVVAAASNRQTVRLAIPLGTPGLGPAQAAVATLPPGEADLWIRLAERSLQCLVQQEQLERLDHENVCFLKQVSDDFEELTFLRSVAEELALGDHSGQSTDLLPYILPLLGQAVGVEGLYFFERHGKGPARVVESWETNDEAIDPLRPAVLSQLMQRFCEQASESPVLRNHVAASDLASDLPGIRDFLLVPVRTKLGLLGWLLAVNCRPRLQIGVREADFDDPRELGTTDASLMSTAAAMAAAHLHNGALLIEKESLLINIVRTLVSAVDSRDPYTCGHSERVALFAERLAAELGYDEERTQQIYLMGLLHDIGKIGVPDAILHKPGKLTDEEFQEMQRHTELGWEILRDLTQMDYVLPGVVHHHERVDGAGYPDGLAGDQIPMEGRLLAVVDAYDAMTSDRPYRAGMTQQKAEQIFLEDNGRHWDPEVVAAFFRIMPDIVAIRQQYQRPTPAVRDRRSSPSSVACSAAPAGPSSGSASTPMP